MMVDVLSEPDAIQQAFNQLRGRWIEGAEPLDRSVGWQGGGGTFTVWWRKDERMWVVLYQSANQRCEQAPGRPVVPAGMSGN